MSNYTALIDRLFLKPRDRLLANSFVERFGAEPRVANRIEALLHEAASINGRVVAGELSPEQGRELLASTATEGFGLMGGVVDDGMAFLSEAAGSDQDSTQEPRGAEPPGRYGDLIDRLFAPHERSAARALVAEAEKEPQLQSRIEPLLHELARSTELGPQQAFLYIADFMRNIGTPAHLIDWTLRAIGGPDEAAHEQQVFGELLGDLTPEARRSLARADREAAQRDVAKYETMLKEEPGKYWGSEANQRAYRQALERSLASEPSYSPPAAPAAAPQEVPLAEPSAGTLPGAGEPAQPAT